MTLEEQFARLMKTLQLIESEPWKWDVAGLECEFNVGRATVERDIRILRNWGKIQRKRGYFAVKEIGFLPTPFTASEALALVLAGTTMTDRLGIPPSEAMRSALRKIDSLLSEKVEAEIKKMRKCISVGVNMVRECNADVLNRISQAIISHNPIEMKYYAISRSEVTVRKVDPYGLTFRFGGWYLIGYCHLRGEVRTFGVDRVRSLTILNRHFRYPPEFNLEEYLERGWALQADQEPEEVVLRFHKRIVPWIANCKFHPHQSVTTELDGSALFKVTVAGVDEIRHWVLSFGDAVEVLSPDSLRAAVASVVGNAAAIYSQRG